MQYGTSTDEVANATPKLRWLETRVTSLRNAKLAPRRTMPSAARLSGTNNVRVIDANASEKPVHSTTSTKISQTWLASHTGPIAWLTTVRGRAPARVPPATRSQNPAPKSAPPNSAYAVIPTMSTNATASAIACTRELGVAPRAGRNRAARRVGPVELEAVVLLAEATAHDPQHEHQRDRDPDVQDRDREERDPDAGVRRRAL